MKYFAAEVPIYPRMSQKQVRERQEAWQESLEGFLRAGLVVGVEMKPHGDVT